MSKLIEKRTNNIKLYIYIYILTKLLMEPGGLIPIHKGFHTIIVLCCINPIPSIDTYFFKIHSNIVVLSARRSC